MGNLFQPQMTQFLILDFYRMVRSAIILNFYRMVHSPIQDFLRKAIFIVTAAFFQDKDPALFMFVPIRFLLLLSSLGGHGQLWLLPLQFLDPRYYPVVHTDYYINPLALKFLNFRPYLISPVLWLIPASICLLQTHALISTLFPSTSSDYQCQGSNKATL